MIKVFHFILDHRVGGPHVYVGSLINALNDRVALTLVTTGHGAATELSLTNLRHRLKALYPVEVLWNVFRLLWLFRNAAAWQECIFDVHGAANIAPIVAARLLGIPVVWHFHETLPGVGGLVRLGKAVLAGTPHGIVAVANKSRKVYRLDNADLIPAPVDAAYWQVTDQRREERAKGALFRLVAVGNLNPLKGMDVLLDAIAGLDVPWELVIVGAELSTFRDYAALLHEKGRSAERGGGVIRFVGWQPTDSVRELLACADVFVLPSRSEACPIALLEAMAMECACVATDVGDVMEMVGDAGIVLPAESPELLLQGLKRVHALGPVGRRQMGVCARQRVARHYSPEVVAKRHLQIYTALLQRSSRS